MDITTIKSYTLKEIADNYNNSEEIVNEKAYKLLSEIKMISLEAANKGNYYIYYNGLMAIHGNKLRENVKNKLIELLKKDYFDAFTPSGKPYYELYVSWEEI